MEPVAGWNDFTWLPHIERGSSTILKKQPFWSINTFSLIHQVRLLPLIWRLWTPFCPPSPHATLISSPDGSHLLLTGLGPLHLAFPMNSLRVSFLKYKSAFFNALTQKPSPLFSGKSPILASLYDPVPDHASSLSLWLSYCVLSKLGAPERCRILVSWPLHRLFPLPRMPFISASLANIYSSFRSVSPLSCLHF